MSENTPLLCVGVGFIFDERHSAPQQKYKILKQTVIWRKKSNFLFCQLKHIPVCDRYLLIYLILLYIALKYSNTTIRSYYFIIQLFCQASKKRLSTVQPKDSLNKIPSRFEDILSVFISLPVILSFSPRKPKNHL